MLWKSLDFVLGSCGSLSHLHRVGKLQELKECYWIDTMPYSKKSWNSLFDRDTWSFSKSVPCLNFTAVKIKQAALRQMREIRQLVLRWLFLTHCLLCVRSVSEHVCRAPHGDRPLCSRVGSWQWVAASFQIHTYNFCWCSKPRRLTLGNM